MRGEKTCHPNVRPRDLHTEGKINFYFWHCKILFVDNVTVVTQINYSNTNKNFSDSVNFTYVYIFFLDFVNLSSMQNRIKLQMFTLGLKLGNNILIKTLINPVIFL